MKQRIAIVLVVVALVLAPSGSLLANWSDTFDDEPVLDWQFECMPDVTKTFVHTIETEPSGNKYLVLDETTSADEYGSQFGGAFASTEEFTDVRVGAVVNVTGDASWNYCGLTARTEYFVDPDGSISGIAPGLVATKVYVMHVNWEDGPGNLRIDIEKVVNLQNIMRNEGELGLEPRVSGLDHARSYYAELDVIGSVPTYVTGSLYEYKGGPLVVRTATMVDTSGNDPWEDEGVHDEPFASGVSGVFSQNEQGQPAGYHCTFDDIFSAADGPDGPSAVNRGPADGATGVSADTDLNWVEAAFATSRELWFGKKGAMQKVSPAPTGTTYDPGPLEYGQTYEWRVDQVGASGTATGHTWTFTTGDCLTVDDFESYADTAAIEAAWPHNISGGHHYIFLETGQVRQGAKSMRFEYQNQYEPWLTEATLTFDSAQDWTANGVKALSMVFRGDDANVEQPISIKLEDATAGTDTVPHPYTYAVQSESWNDWDINLQEFSGVDLTAVKKITIVIGNGTNSGQEVEDRDVVYIDHIKLCPARCFNVDQLDLSGDVNGDCVIDFKDIAAAAAGWLNNGLSILP
ncbi:MAG: hypothetical protein JSU70_08035 [Phycisphaerales bacterium]|nr:MAG: hypothetical protein JSU70_08035 [Phycisphaerales bacterium]